jgi:predicted O-methyltransferase YrrM
MNSAVTTSIPSGALQSSAWEDDVRAVAADLARVISAAAPFILLDEEQLRGALPNIGSAIPFPERDGHWWGLPEDDAAAIAELERQCRAGVQFIAIAWPAFWWLKHYPGFHRLLRWSFPCVLRNDRLIVYDLRARKSAGAGWALARSMPQAFGLKRLGSQFASAFDRLRWWLGMSTLATSRHASAMRHLCDLLSSVERSALPRLTLGDLLRRYATPHQVKVHPLLRGGGSGSAAEIAALAAITAAKRPGRILEFGTYDGCSTWHLWANSDESAQITTLDLPPNTKVEGSSDGGYQGVTHRPFLPLDPRVRLIETDTRHWKPDIAAVDLCFIDAGHSYQCVKNDTEIALRLMSPGGIIVWHDATWRRDGYGVNRYLLEKRREGLDVRQLVISDFDFCSLAVLLL